MTGDPRIPCGPAGLPALSAPDEAQAKAALRKALIGQQLLAWWRAQSARAIGVYWPLRGEPDLSSAYAELARAGAQLLLPVVLGPNRALGFSHWTPGEAMHKDGMGVAVPANLRMAERPPLLLVPCLGFNRANYRLGYGGGYYDRTLESLPRPRTVGVAYACCEADFASAPHDVALDLVLTEASELAWVKP